MPCEEHREGLTHGAEGAELSADLRAHVDVCPECRKFFETERQLFCAIDSGVRLAANAEVPASFLSRVRAQLNGRSSPRPFLIPAWVAVAVVPALTLAAVAFRAGHHETKPPDLVNPEVARAVAPATRDVPPISERTAPRVEVAERVLMRHVARRTEPSLAFEHVPVLVPSGQKAAVDNLILSLRRGSVDATALVVQRSDTPPEELRIAPLELSPIVMKPLEEASGGTPALKSETNR